MSNVTDKDYEQLPWQTERNIKIHLAVGGIGATLVILAIVIGAAA